MRFLLVLAILVFIAIGMWLGNILNFSMGPSGEGDGAKNTALAPKEDAGPEPLVVDGTLRVRIAGDAIFVRDEETTIEKVAQLATEHDAKVLIMRTSDAERRPREELERTLRDRNIHVVVE